MPGCCHLPAGTCAVTLVAGCWRPSVQRPHLVPSGPFETHPWISKWVGDPYGGLTGVVNEQPRRDCLFYNVRVFLVAIPKRRLTIFTSFVEHVLPLSFILAHLLSSIHIDVENTSLLFHSFHADVNVLICSKSYNCNCYIPGLRVTTCLHLDSVFIINRPSVLHGLLSHSLSLTPIGFCFAWSALLTHYLPPNPIPSTDF